MKRFLAPLRIALTLALLGLLLGCGETAPERDTPRGILLISLDTLRADHLGAYGYDLETTPFLDELAKRSVIFEQAYVPLPGTLPSHMSLFTSLYPLEHGTILPESVLSAEIPTLPEIFQRGGFRTGGFVEGGYVSGRYGFSRGFDEFIDENQKIEDDIERTLGHGLDFLRKVGEDEKFFLFLHSYAVHDPYFPKQEYLDMFWQGEAPATAVRATGPELVAVNNSGREVPGDELRYYRALYDAQIRYVDDLLRGFFAELEALGVLDDTLVVITSDHGEEFHEHGALLHSQAYRETLHVPLFVVWKGFEPRRIESVVENLDIAPTLYEITGVQGPETLSGHSLLPVLEGGECVDCKEAYSQNHSLAKRVLFQSDERGMFQLRVLGVEDTWIPGEITFDHFGQKLSFKAQSFHQPRTLQVLADGEPFQEIEINDAAPTPIDLDFGADADRTRITLRTSTCSVPAEVMDSPDRRCLSVRFIDLTPQRLELSDIAADPFGQQDISGLHLELVREMYRRLRNYEREAVAKSQTRELEPELQKHLESLGYL